jgi:hypothetical protein
MYTIQTRSLQEVHENQKADLIEEPKKPCQQKSWRGFLLRKLLIRFPINKMREGIPLTN